MVTMDVPALNILQCTEKTYLSLGKVYEGAGGIIREPGTELNVAVEFAASPEANAKMPRLNNVSDTSMQHSFI
jgi:hypothetical protein